MVAGGLAPGRFSVLTNKMRDQDLLSTPKLVLGSFVTTAGATASFAAESSKAIQEMEPQWLSIAIKLATLCAGFATFAAAIVRFYLDIRKDRREERAASHDISN